MLILLKILAVQIGWLGSFPIYLSADQQVLLTKPFSKGLAWGLFIPSVIVCTVMLSELYHPLAASIITLCVSMTSWIGLALILPHFNKAKLSATVIAGSAFMLIAASLGGADVG